MTCRPIQWNLMLINVNKRCVFICTVRLVIGSSPAGARARLLAENTARCEMTCGGFLFVKCLWVQKCTGERAGRQVYLFVLAPWLWPWLPLWFVQCETKSLNQSFRMPSPFPPLKQLHFGPSGFQNCNNGGCAAPWLCCFRACRTNKERFFIWR